VGHPAKGTQGPSFEVGIDHGLRRMPSLALKVGPRMTAPIDVLEPEIVPMEEFAESHAGLLCAEVGDERCPARSTDSSLQIVEDDVSALAIEVHRAAGRQERELVRNLVDDRTFPGIDDCSKSVLKTEVSMLLPNQVDDRQAALGVRPS
jgi:hypothetical protein